MSEFRNIIGTSNESRIIEKFVEWPDTELCMKDIVDETKLDEKTINEILVKFEYKKIIKKGEDPKFYYLNQETFTSKALLHLYKNIIVDSLKEVENDE